VVLRSRLRCRVATATPLTTARDGSRFRFDRFPGIIVHKPDQHGPGEDMRSERLGCLLERGDSQPIPIGPQMLTFPRAERVQEAIDRSIQW
jgi:hypothetical protein